MKLHGKKEGLSSLLAQCIIAQKDEYVSSVILYHPPTDVHVSLYEEHKFIRATGPRLPTREGIKSFVPSWPPSEIHFGGGDKSYRILPRERKIYYKNPNKELLWLLKVDADKWFRKKFRTQDITISRVLSSHIIYNMCYPKDFLRIEGHNYSISWNGKLQYYWYDTEAADTPFGITLDAINRTSDAIGYNFDIDYTTEWNVRVDVKKRKNTPQETLERKQAQLRNAIKNSRKK